MTVMIAPMSERFVAAMERFAETHGLDLVTFAKGQRKDEVAQKYSGAATLIARYFGVFENLRNIWRTRLDYLGPIAVTRPISMGCSVSTVGS